MKKILRMALVLVLAGSALLYTSCTKDYSPDISSLQEQIDAINNNTDGLPWVKTTLQGLVNDLNALKPKVTIGDDALKTQIDNLTTQVNTAIGNINTALDKKADKSAVQEELLNVNNAIDDLKARLDALDGEEGRIAELEEAIASLGTASAAIGDLFSEYAKFIQSIAYVPSSTFGFEEANAFVLTDRETLTDPLLVLSFMITPPEAVSRVTEETAKMVAVATKAAAAAPEQLEIKKLVYRDDAPGYVDVFATIEVEDDELVPALRGQMIPGFPGLAVALEVGQEVGEGDAKIKEYVTSDYAHVLAGEPQDLLFQVYDAEEGGIIPPYGYREDHEVQVSPSSQSDSVKVFTADRWSIVADVAGSYMTPAEAKELFGVSDIKLVSPIAGDTIYDLDCDDTYYAYEPAAFESTMHPVRPKTVVDLIVDGKEYGYLGVAVQNGHVSGPESGWAYGVYHAVPDTVRLALTPEHPVVIPWDYKYYDDIKDTLIAKIWVDGDREKLVDADKTPTWNKETETDYTQGVGAITRHTNDKTAIDANLLSKAEYGKVDSTYVYSIQKFDPSIATEYVGEFDYVVKARPADAVIELGPIDTMVRFDAVTNIKVDAIIAAYNLHKAAYAPYTLDEVAADALAMGQQKGVEITIDGKPADASLVTAGDFGYANGKETTNFDVKLNKVGEWKITVKTVFANINYTFVVTINAINNPAHLAPKVAYVTVDDAETKNYSVEVKGDVDTTAGAPNRYHYFIKDMPFTDYLKVVDYAEDSEELKVELKTLTKMVSGNTVWAPYKPTDLERLAEDPTTANLAKDNSDDTSHQNFRWDSYDSLQFEVAALLYPVADGSARVDSATVRLWTKNPIPVFDGGDLLVVEHEKDQLASANIAANLTIRDLNNIALNDEKGLRAIGYDADADEVVVNYGQAITYGNIDEIEIIGGADYIGEVDLTWDSQKPGVLNLRLNQGVIVEPIIVKVPVKLSHMLDRGLEDFYTAYVTVKFVEKGSVVTPEP